MIAYFNGKILLRAIVFVLLLPLSLIALLISLLRGKLHGEKIDWLPRMRKWRARRGYNYYICYSNYKVNFRLEAMIGFLIIMFYLLWGVL